MDKAYNFSEYEPKIYDLWEKSGAFTPNLDSNKKPFSLMMPPPNANADLHTGHALYVLQDIFTRYARMNGYNALYLPGADHAGIETQFVYEKHLEKEDKSRFDFSREELYKQIYAFVDKNRHIMEAQLRRMGLSCDWTRLTYTLDDHIIDRTYKTFKKLSDDGLLYRSDRLVNYCTRHQTSFSDLEVEYREEEGSLWYFNYPIADSQDVITVATTRPETMLGDVAVAVHPEDDRYKNLVGKLVRLPLTDRKIPVISDEMVDREFGTGAVKITPAHDFNDFAVAERHNLPIIQVIGLDGKMTDEAPEEFRGLKINPAREAVAAALEKGRYLAKVEKYQNRVGVCYKCGTKIEPLPIDQWLVRMKPLATEAIKAIEQGRVKVVPEHQTKVLLYWLENIIDWNITRQPVWGIPIPAYKCQKCRHWTVDISKNVPKCEKCGGKTIADPDSFDTWFSSGQWPYAALHYPSKESKIFYPTTIMDTAAEIIFFWVARMIMLGLYVTGDVPFKYVYLHGLLVDKDGKKMSKSKGNAVNPMELVDKYGSDALRFALVANVTPYQKQRISEDKIQGYRNFANKIWNASRFVMMFESESKPKQNQDDKAVLRELEDAKKYISEALNKFMVHEAAQKAYSFFWHYFCDIYLEQTKNRRGEAQENLEFVLKESLKLLHPFMPFVTEAVWQEIEKGSMLISESWPLKQKQLWP